MTKINNVVVLETMISKETYDLLARKYAYDHGMPFYRVSGFEIEGYASQIICDYVEEKIYGNKENDLIKNLRTGKQD